MKKILLPIMLFLLSCESKVKDNSFEGDNKIEFISLKGIPVVKGKLNNKETYFIIDSGASVSVLNEKEKDKFGFSTSESDIEAAGYGGTANFMDVFGAEIEIGGVKFITDFKAQDLTAIVNIVSKSQGVEISGIIGSDIMHKNDFVINYSEGSISLGN